MANHHGSEGEVYNASNQVAEVTGWNIEATAEFAEDTLLTETAKTTHSVGITQWSGQVECWYDDTDTNGQLALIEGSSVTLNLRPEGTGSSNAQYSGTARITRISHGVARGQIQTLTIAFEGSGALSRTAQ